MATSATIVMVRAKLILISRAVQLAGRSNAVAVVVATNRHGKHCARPELGGRLVRTVVANGDIPQDNEADAKDSHGSNRGVLQ